MADHRYLLKSGSIAKIFLILGLFCLSVLHSPEMSVAADTVPRRLNYQGRLMDASDNLLTGTYYLCFSIWDNATVGLGSQLWPSGTPSTTQITTSNGVFSAEIGSADTLDLDFDTYDYYLQVYVNDTNSCTSGGETLSPRQHLTSAAYSINADMLDGLDAAASGADAHIAATDSSGNLISSAQIQVGSFASAPTALGVGALYYNSTDGNIYVWDGIGSAWVDLTSVGGGGYWQLSTNVLNPTDSAYDFAVGGTTLSASMFGIDESDGNFYFGYDNSANPTFLFEATDNDAGTFGFNTNDSFYFSDAKVGIGTTAPAWKLHIQDNSAADVRIRSENTVPASTSNYSALDLATMTEVRARSALFLKAGFSDTTDATRTSNVYFYTSSNGTSSESLTIAGYNVGIGTVTPDYRLSIAETSTETASASRATLRNTRTVAPTSNSGTINRGFWNTVTVPGTTTVAINEVTANYIETFYSGTGGVSTVKGQDLLVAVYSGAGSVINLYATTSNPYTQSSTNISGNSYSFFTDPSYNGTVANHISYYSDSSTATNDWGAYLLNAKNYFAGNTRIGLTEDTSGLTEVPLVVNTSIRILGDNSVSQIQPVSFGVTSSNNFPTIAGRAARGSAASPSAVQTDDILLRMGGSGYGATSFAGANKADIEFKAAENWTDSAQGTYIRFRTVDNTTTTLDERMRIDHNGNVGIGVIPVNKFQVSDSYSDLIPRSAAVITSEWTPSGVQGTIYPTAMLLSATYDSSYGFSSGFQTAFRNFVYSKGSVGIGARVQDLYYANEGSGTVGTVNYVHIRSVANTGGGAVTTVRGVYIENQTAGTYNRGIESMIDSGSNRYNLYISGNADNYFAGNVGIGVTSPSAALHINGDTQQIIVQKGGTDRFSANIGDLTFDFNTLPESTANTTIRFFRSTNTTGTKQVLFLKGDNSTAVHGAIGVDGANSYFNNAGGKVGVGTATPDSNMQISGGGLCVGSNANCNTDNNTEGVVYSSSTAMTVYDVAEMYPTMDTSIKPGELVTLDRTKGVFIERSNSNNKNSILGIVSTEPGVLLGGFAGKQFKEEYNVPVALSGRVPTRVATTNGNIEIGDKLKVSSQPGVAEKANSPTQIIGTALESYSGNKIGLIQVFVNLSWYEPESYLTKIDKIIADYDNNLLNGGVSSIPSKLIIDSIKAQTGIFSQISGNELNIGNGKLKIDALGNVESIGAITAKKLIGNSIQASQLFAEGNNDLSINLATGKSFVIKDDENNEIFKISEDGKIIFPLQNGDSSVGEGILPAGELEIFIKNSLITGKSKIFITPKVPITQGIAVVERSEGKGFKAAIKNKESIEVKFDYWIVN